ncbi:TPR repeat-containing protein DDB_G0287407-like [Lineus longissimus]|uniref:TPR repeat-containing protein DDB_G0287407-like n=1 Tax=Lineus longissimus TaxID=88925 RepID=UPI002B4E2A37
MMETDRSNNVINVFVTSCDRDFHTERHVVINEVMPVLKSWCLSHGKELNCYDIRWGGGQTPDQVDNLKKILEQMKVLYYEKQMPFFLNVTSDMLEKVPLWGDSDARMNQFKKFIKYFHLEPEEVDILYSAYREDNPNGILLMRDDGFHGDLDDDVKSLFITQGLIQDIFHETLPGFLKSKYPDDRIIRYGCQYSGGGRRRQHQLVTMDENFTSQLLELLKKKIGLELGAGRPVEPFEIVNLMQKDFLKMRSQIVRGREDSVKLIEDYIFQEEKDVPLVILGDSGAGKTSLMSKAAETVLTKAANSELSMRGDKPWQVFYHFVGAVPGSTDLEQSIKRLIKEFNIVQQDSAMPKDLTAVCQMCCHYLSNPNSPPTIVFMDAINQFTVGKDASVLSWLPRKLAPQVRCVISMMTDSKELEYLQARESKSQELHIPTLSLQARREISSELLEKNHRDITSSQMDRLLEKQSATNPLWLAFACEELSLIEDHSSINNDIDNLEEGLTNLLEMVLQRKETEPNGNMAVAVLCLLEVSSSGLLQTELCTILSEDKTLMPPSPFDEKEETEKAEKESSEKKGQKDRILSEEKWSAVNSTLKAFLRPYGDSSEGRIDFFHRAISKAVRKRYFNIGSSLNDSEEEGLVTKLWWHGKLAEYFEKTDNLERKVEELPYQLTQINDPIRLSDCLTDWNVFDSLYNEEYSAKLLLYWRQMEEGNLVSSYRLSLSELEAEQGGDQDLMARRHEHVARVFLQAGQYVDALELANTAMKLEQEMGKRPERMVELYLLMSEIYDAKLKLNDFVSPAQLPDLRKTISFCEKSIALRRNLEGDYHKAKLAIGLMKLAFSLESWDACGADSTLNGDEALKQGNKYIESALEIFKALNDQGHYAEALMTKGVLAPRGSMEQLKLYHEALDICMQLYGERHILMSRLYINIGIVYEDNKNYLKSYEYFKKWARVSEEVLGPNHPKTLRAKGVLNETRYRIIAQRIEDSGNNMDDNSLQTEELQELGLEHSGVDLDNTGLVALTQMMSQHNFTDNNHDDEVFYETYEMDDDDDEGDDEINEGDIDEDDLLNLVDESHYLVDWNEIETDLEHIDSNIPDNENPQQHEP